MADLISSDLFAMLEERAIAWGYVGVHDVEGIPAHHIAIVGENRDLQLWIQKDGNPLPLKLVITYKNVAQAPQYEAILMDWEVGSKVSAASFEPTLPEGAEQEDYLALNLVATYKALGGGWQIRDEQGFVSEARQERMQQRTDWGSLIPAKPLREGLPTPPPGAQEQPWFNEPSW